MSNEQVGVERLDVTRAEGLWAVRSASRTIYYLDLDRGRVMRVGSRARYLTDPLGGVRDYEWRLQRVVTSIERVTGEETAGPRDRWATRAVSSEGARCPSGTSVPGCASRRTRVSDPSPATPETKDIP